MARHWRRLALAVLAAAAVSMTCACVVEAQAPAKSKKAKAAKPEESEQAAEGEAAAPKKKAKQDPAQAQRTIEAAVKLLEAGKAEPAAQSLSAVLSGGNLPPAIMAKALLYRGIAYRQQKLPAQAIADLTSALWLKGGLGESDRADALRQRASAYQEAGLTGGGDGIAPAVPNAAHAPTRTASATQGWGASTTSSPSTNLAPAAQDEPAATKPSGSSWSIGNPFAALFGSPSPAPSSPPPQAAPAPTATASIERAEPVETAAQPRPRTSAWSRNTEVHSGPASAATSAAAPAKPEGKFRIQVGIVRTQDEAQAIAAKVKREYAAAMATREPEIDQTVVGNMGSFYRVRVGPFSTQQDGHATCAKLKGSGLDCLVVAQ